MPNKAVLAGGRGFLGAALARRLAAPGREVVVLSRVPAECHPIGDNSGRIRAVAWDGESVGAWAAELDGAAALVNLAGRSVNCIHTPENRRAILESRVDSVRALGGALKQCARPPPVWVQAGAIGYYGTRGGGRCDEATPPGDDFLAGVCRQWEEAFAAACPARVRPVVLRLGLVLGRDGGAFPLLAKLARRGLGGSAGSGRQGMSWIHLADAEEIFLRALTDGAMRGPYNACSPQPAANAEFMRELRAAARRPWSPPAPAFAVALVARHFLRTDPSLVLDGQFAVPARLEAEGFPFRHPGLAGALRDLLQPAASAARSGG